MSELVGGRITVGVDGSPASVAALRWAADLARLRDAEIIVVRAWHVPLDSLAPYAPMCRRPTPEAERRRAADDLTGAMRAVFGSAPDVKAHAMLVCGPPARVIVDQCADADLLVLGGHHADSPLRQTVGAIAATCLRQVLCPVVIVTPTAASPWPEVSTAPTTEPAKPEPSAEPTEHSRSPGVRVLQR